MPKKEKTTEEETPKFIESELYKGKVKVKFYPLSHQYWISLNGAPAKRKSGSTTFIGIKDKSTPLGLWQQQMTADFLLKLIEKGTSLTVGLISKAPPVGRLCAASPRSWAPHGAGYRGPGTSPQWSH